MPRPAIDILGVRVHPLTVPELHRQMAGLIEDDSHAQVLNVNVHCLNLAVEHSWLREMLNQAEIVFCDGAGVMLGARLLGHHIPERITYADWFWQLASLAEERQYSLFFLGARPGVAQAAADRLQARFPRLHIVGVESGYFDQSPGSPDNEAMIARINAARPNILTLGMGMPRQERWLHDNWARLDTNIALTGGAVFDYLSGSLQRSPKWLNDHGLEWLGRLMIEPRRLWQRYLVGNPQFLARVLRARLDGKQR